MLLRSSSLYYVNVVIWQQQNRVQRGAKSFVCVGLLTNVSVRLDRSNTKPHLTPHLLTKFFIFKIILPQLKCYFEYELVIQIAKSQPYYIFSV